VKRPLHILIADRNPHVREFIKREAAADGHRIDAAENGRELLRWIYRDETIDLVSILMRISARDFTVTDVTTTNSFGDETFIALDRYRFNLQPDDDAFLFHIPEGADVVHLAE